MTVDSVMRIARVEVDQEGDWILTVAGTDIRRRLWNDRDVPYEIFPGSSMGHRLVELGWMPDRRSQYSTKSFSKVERLMLTAMAGWRKDGEKRWTIPCYRVQQ